MDSSTDDQTHSFLLHADRVIAEANFIINSLPNVEPFSAERALRNLYSVYHILSDLDDQWLTAGDVDELADHVLDTAEPLYQFLKNPPPPDGPVHTFIYTKRRGRPRFRLNLTRAIELHDLGCTWESIAQALGITRQTLYNHLSAAGLSTARPVYTEIEDDDLDELVASIIVDHPLAGSNIVSGHLLSRGFRVPVLRTYWSVCSVSFFYNVSQL
jgi:hypothetical protein